MALSKPSSPDPVYTPGTARGAKLAALLVDEGTSLVRKIFEDEVQNMNPPSLRAQLKKHKRFLYHGEIPKRQGKKHRVLNLNPGQKKTLYPASGDVPPDTAQGFDISLLELLLKELVWLELGREAPYSGERDRLRRFRNANYGHISSTELSEEDFYRLWKELTDILVALGGDRDKISERLNSSVDPEQEAKHFTLLEQLYKEDMEVKDLLLAQGESQRQLRSLVEEVRDNQRAETSSKVCAESSHSAEQIQQGPSDLIDDVIACLKDLYATEYAHVRPLPWFEDLDLKCHLGEVYTNLQLQQRDGRGRFQGTDTIVSLADIYNTREGESSQASVRSSVRKIRVEGGPGIGKSCSCQKLAFDWSCGKLERFKAVFFLEMRHLAGKVKDAIFKQLLPEDTKTTPDQLWSYIQENQDDVLFILDGLDELSQTSREVTDVVKLIQGKILRNCHVLVTSRPYHCVKDLGKCHQFYKIVGYTKKNSEEFIRKYFCKSPESASKLVKHLRCNRNLSEIVSNPLNNLLICVLWQYNNEKLHSSKADLYQDIVDSVAKRFCKKRDPEFEGDQLPPHIEESLRGLGKLAWEGLEQEQLQFIIGEIKKEYATTADNMLNMGLLTRDYSFSRTILTRYCAFLHKTFQEYMAARYISGLVMDGSSREEGMKCVCRLFGLSDATVMNRKLIITSHRKYREVQNCLLLILGENSRPLFDRLAEELNKAQTDEDRNLLSFLCTMWLGTSCAGGKLADIVASCLSQHATNNMDDFGCKKAMFYPDDHANWCVGLAHVLTCQKKLTATGESVIQHLKVNSFVFAPQQEELGVLENALSDYDAMRSVTLIGTGSESSYLLRTYIPRCGTESVFIRSKGLVIPYSSLKSTLEQLSAVARIEHVTVEIVISDRLFRGEGDKELSEFDRLLARMIESQTRLKSLRLEIGCWVTLHHDSKVKRFRNLTATLQSISEHTRLEVVQFELRGEHDLPITDDASLCEENQHETFNVEPSVDMLTECVKKNKVLKTLRLKWRIDTSRRSLLLNKKIYHGDCSSQSLSSLCSAIRENRTLETLVVEGMLSHSEHRADMISELIRNKPGNYNELSITLSDSIHVDTSDDDTPDDDDDTSDDDTPDDDDDTSDDDTSDDITCDNDDDEGTRNVCSCPEPNAGPGSSSL